MCHPSTPLSLQRLPAVSFVFVFSRNKMRHAQNNNPVQFMCTVKPARCRYHYCVNPERLLLISPYTLLSSATFSFNAVQPVYLLWTGSNGDESPIRLLIESGIQFRVDDTPQSTFLLQDRFAFIANQSRGTTQRPSRMNAFQNVLGVIYSGYSVGCSGFAELYSLGREQLHSLCVHGGINSFCIRRSDNCPVSCVSCFCA